MGLNSGSHCPAGGAHAHANQDERFYSTPSYYPLAPEVGPLFRIIVSYRRWADRALPRSAWSPASAWPTRIRAVVVRAAWIPKPSVSLIESGSDCCLALCYPYSMQKEARPGTCPITGLV